MKRAPYRVRTHGHCRGDYARTSLTYRAWSNIHRRCRRQDGYLGRIAVCERWSTYEPFLADMGERPSAKHSIDRIDNARGYEPDNCRWATVGEQNRNKRTNVLLTHPETGETMCAVDWANRLGIQKSALHWRLKRWPLAKALTPEDHRRTRGAA